MWQLGNFKLHLWLVFYFYWTALIKDSKLVECTLGKCVIADLWMDIEEVTVVRMVQ